MKVLRTLGILAGSGMVFLGLMPQLGMITDWETITSAERMMVGALGGVVIGIGLVLIALASGLLFWIFNKYLW